MNDKVTINNKWIDLDKLLDQAIDRVELSKQNTDHVFMEINSAGEASEARIQNVLRKIAFEIGTEDIASIYICVALLIQMGATAPAMPRDTKITYEGVTVNVGMLSRHCKSEKVTIRQVARKLKSAIPKIVMTMGDGAPEGNLAKQMRLELKGVTNEEAIWASDFQTYNEECPERVRNWLVKDYRNKFNR